MDAISLEEAATVAADEEEFQLEGSQMVESDQL
jgi:hypothetical protein